MNTFIKGGVIIPKIIENLQEEILACGRKILLEEGYAKLTMRRAATESGIAVGTVYNYFSSKEILVAHVMLEDWIHGMAQAEAQIREADSIVKGMEILYDSLAAFSGKYRSVWEEYGGFPKGTGSRHELLIGQIGTIVRGLLERFNAESDPDPSRFLSETLLHASSMPDTTFESIKPFIIKII